MSLVKRSDVAIPALASEVVPVPALGGDVEVHSMGLTERLIMASSSGDVTFENVARVLSRCVVGGSEDEGKAPLMTQAEWESWGRDNVLAILDLWTAVQRVSLINEADVEKK